MHRWAQRLGERRVVGIDLEEESIQAGWAQRQAPNLEYRVMRAENLPFADGEFDLASAIEVLEHVPDPAHTLAEMARCAAAPPARLGPARAAVAGAQHGPRRLPARRSATPRAPQPLVAAVVRAPARALRDGRRGALALPVDDAACPPLAPPRRSPSPRRRRAPRRPAPTAAARALLSVGIAATGLLTFAYFSIASPRARRRSRPARGRAVVGDVRRHLGDLPAGRTAALAHDRRAPRARARARTRCASRSRSRPASRSPSSWSRSRCTKS